MFENAKSKIERAYHHICDFETRFSGFVLDKPHRFGVERDVKTGKSILRITFTKSIPSDFPLIIGDAIHNFRTSLDHMTWELVGIDGGTQNRHLALPTGNNRINFESRCDGVVTPSQWVKNALKSLEVFPGGTGQDLYALSEMDNSDKHRVITLTLQATGHPPFRVLKPGLDLQMAGGSFFDRTSNQINIIEIDPGDRVEFDNNADCPPEICIKDAFSGHLIPTQVAFGKFREAVTNALKIIETAVVKHSGG